MLSKIKSIEIRACRGGDELESLDTVAAVKLPGGSRPDFTVVTITTEDGVQEHHLVLAHKMRRLQQRQCHR